MPRVFKINVNGTDYDVTVQELSDVSSQLMPQYRPAPPRRQRAAPAIVPPPPPRQARSGAGSGDQSPKWAASPASWSKRARPLPKATRLPNWKR